MTVRLSIIYLAIATLAFSCRNSHKTEEGRVDFYKSFFETVIFDDEFHAILIDNASEYPNFNTDCIPCNLCLVIDTVISERLTPLYPSFVENEFVSDETPRYDLFEQALLTKKRDVRALKNAFWDLDSTYLQSAEWLESSTIEFGSLPAKLSQPCLFLSFWKPVTTDSTVYYRVVVKTNFSGENFHKIPYNNIIISVDAATGKLKHYQWMYSSNV